MTQISRRDALATIGSAAALPLLGQAASAQSNALTVRVAYVPSEGSAQLFYALENGLFSKAGLNVELQPNPLVDAIVATVASNAADIGTGTIMTIAAAHAKKQPFTLLAAANAFDVGQPPGGMLMAGSKDVRHGSDLNGKKIGAPRLGTLGEYGVRAWVDAGGGDSSTLQFVEVPFAEMPAALASGRVDAAFVSGPYLAPAKKVAHTVAVEFDAIANDFLVGCWYATTNWANGHQRQVTLFAQAIRDATDWAKANPSQCPAILAKYLKVDVAQIAPARVFFARSLDPVQIQPGIDLTAKYADFDKFPARDIIWSPPRRRLF